MGVISAVGAVGIQLGMYVGGKSELCQYSAQKVNHTSKSHINHILGLLLVSLALMTERRLQVELCVYHAASPFGFGITAALVQHFCCLKLHKQAYDKSIIVLSS
jgi:hypothetical protein